MLRNTRMKTKLVGGFVIAAIIVALTGLVGILMVEGVGGAADEILHREYPLAHASLEMAATVQAQLYHLHAFLLGETGEKEAFDRHAAEFTRLANEIGQMELETREAELLADVKRYGASFAAKADEAMTTKAEKKAESDATMEAADKLSDNLTAAVTGLVDAADKHMKNAMDRADTMQTVSRWTLPTVVVVAFLMALIGGFTLSAGITGRLSRLVADARAIGGGDLTVDVANATDGDEIGNVAAAFRDMVGNLREQTKDLVEGVNVLATSVSEISAAVSQLASSSTETASAVAETTTTVEEVKQTSQVANEKAKMVSDSAQEQLRTSEAGEKAAGETQQEIARISEQMDAIADSVVRLSEQSQMIGDIISSVDDLSEQSNLLAVNAAVEAAKAGDQGKGFAVVAQEIRSLAEQSKQSTTQVRGILNDIQKAVSAAVMATEQGSKAVDSGVRQSKEAGEAIQRLTRSVTSATQAATQIAAASQQQFVGVDQVTTAMENIKEASEQNVESTRQLETLAGSLKDLGEKLRDLSTRYKV